MPFLLPNQQCQSTEGKSIMSVEHKMKLTGGGRAGFGCSVSLLFYIRFGRCRL